MSQWGGVLQGVSLTRRAVPVHHRTVRLRAILAPFALIGRGFGVVPTIPSALGAPATIRALVVHGVLSSPGVDPGLAGGLGLAAGGAIAPNELAQLERALVTPVTLDRIRQPGTAGPHSHAVTDLGAFGHRAAVAEQTPPASLILVGHGVLPFPSPGAAPGSQRPPLVQVALHAACQARQARPRSLTPLTVVSPVRQPPPSPYQSLENLPSESHKPHTLPCSSRLFQAQPKAPYTQTRLSNLIRLHPHNLYSFCVRLSISRCTPPLPHGVPRPFPGTNPDQTGYPPTPFPMVTVCCPRKRAATLGYPLQRLQA
jgi:hypothetical protein